MARAVTFLAFTLLISVPQKQSSSNGPGRGAVSAAPSPGPLPDCIPGWSGRLLIDCNSLSGWAVEHDNGSSGTLQITGGLFGDAVQMNWDIGTGDWVQARYAFERNLDLSGYDIFGVTLRGCESISNRTALMFVDADGVFFGFNCDNLNTVDRWMINLSLPKKLLVHFFTIGPNPDDRTIDWSRIERFYLVAARPAGGGGGGSGTLTIDHVQADRAAEWPRQNGFESIEPDQASVEKALDYVFEMQKNSGLFQSWSSEPFAYAYDQGLVLITTAREGVWDSGVPQNSSARAAKKLADFLIAHQRPEGNWPASWNAETGAECAPPLGVGGDAWVALGLIHYANRSGDGAAWQAAEKCGDWLANQIDEIGRLVPSTENNVDAWWILSALRRRQDAARIKNYLLNTVWDQELEYWWRGFSEYPDPYIALDCATWVGEFAKSDRVGRPDMAESALSFVHRTLKTTDDGYSLCGLDVMGPVGLWCEGMGQYISAGGEGSQSMLNTLIALQQPGGGIPNSTEERWTCFGWLSPMTGLAPTCWFYFAQTRPPFEDLISSETKLTLDVIVPQTTPAGDTIYLAGDFNFWDPGPCSPGRDGLNHDLPLSPAGGSRWRIELPFDPGDRIEYKYTRGSWATAETDARGEEPAPRTLTLPGHNLFHSDSVVRWADSPAGGNRILNGDFSSGESGWELTVLGAAQASGTVQNGEYAISIANGGTQVWEINLKQVGLLIENKKTYNVSFDAYVGAPRQINALVGKNAEPWTVYSGSQTFTLTTSKRRYQYAFTMNEPTDPAARLGFDTGLSAADVYFDNIMLTVEGTENAVEAGPSQEADLPADFRLLQNHPNPFNAETKVVYALRRECRVEIDIYDRTGKRVRDLVSGFMPAGYHSVLWDGRDNSGNSVASGVYLCILQTGGRLESRKLILMR